MRELTVGFSPNEPAFLSHLPGIISARSTMNLRSKVLIAVAIAVVCAVACFLGVRKHSSRAPLPAAMGEWSARRIAGVDLEAPGGFRGKSLNFGAAQELLESSEMQIFETPGFEIAVVCAVYKDGVELSFDGAAQGAVAGVAQLPGIRNLQQTTTELTVSGKPARRVALTADRGRKSIRAEMMFIADGRRFFQVQATFDAATPHGAANAERLLKSVRLAK
jgi:hypothetical protein